MNIFTPYSIMVITLVMGASSLFIPFVSNKIEGKNHLLTLLTCCFCLNVFMLDALFLKGVRVSLNFFKVGSYAFGLNLEPIGMIFLNLLAILWFVSLSYTIEYLKFNNVQHKNRFLLFMNLSIFCGVLLSLSSNLITMFCAYELLTLATVPLIVHGGSKESYRQLYRYLSILMISSFVLFLPGILIVYSVANRGDFLELGLIKGVLSDKQSIILLLMFLFGACKSTIYPLHKWLPAAMVASYPVSGLLHAVVVVNSGLFCIYKILVYVFGIDYLQELFPVYNWIILIPIIGVIWSIYQATVATNIKMMLAYSTISQLGISLTSAMMFTNKAIAASIFHMLSHSFAKLALFFAAGVVYSVKRSINLEDLSNLHIKMPRISFAILISCISMIGIPPFGGFVSKLYIMMAASSIYNYFVAAFIAASSVFSALYLLRMCMILYGYDSKITQTDKEVGLNDAFGVKAIYFCIALTFIFFFLQRFASLFLDFI